MGVFRVVGFLALVAACDKGQLEPAKGSAQPPPAPLPSPDPAPPPVDAMSIDEQRVRVAASVKEHTCSDYVQSSRADSEEPMFFDAAGTSFSDMPLGDTAMVRELPPGHWSYHITKLDPKAGTFTYDPRPDVK